MPVINDEPPEYPKPDLSQMRAFKPIPNGAVGEQPYCVYHIALGWYASRLKILEAYLNLKTLLNVARARKNTPVDCGRVA